MPDHATSTDAAVQAQLDRLTALAPGGDVLGLERITRLLSRLGDPHLSLPPVFHVAGTNGKGSTCAFLRAAIEASGQPVHVYASPHLVRFNERIRIAGRLIEDTALAALLAEVLDHADGIGASFFEVTTAAALLAFARTPAAATIVEVGLGGRLDATNVVVPAVAGIAALGIDHQSFLGDTLEQIAVEKAGIAKRDVPLVTMAYPTPIAARIAASAAAAGAPLVARGTAWDVEVAAHSVRYRDTGFSVVTDLPRLVGTHQVENLGLALAMLRHQGVVTVPESAMRAAADWARWPARMQRLGAGPLVAQLPAGSTAWLDGAHNESAAAVVAHAFRTAAAGATRRVLVLGMLENKDADAVIALLASTVDAMIAVPVPGHAHHAPTALANSARRAGIAQAGTAADPAAACAAIAAEGPGAATVLFAGSLYLAGTVLLANDEMPV